MAKNKLTINVLHDVSRKLKGEFCKDKKNNLLVVLNGSNTDIINSIEELKELRNQGNGVSLAFSFMAEKIIDTDRIINSLNPIEIYREEDIFQLDKIVEDYTCIIGVNITVNSISKISTGMVDSFIPLLIWTYLYMKKPVYLDFTSSRYFLGNMTKNKVTKNIIENHIKTLVDLGVVEIFPGKYLESIEYKKSLNEENRIQNKVVTEGDLVNFSKGDTLKIPKGAIITPLAKDKANFLGIHLKMEE